MAHSEIAIYREHLGIVGPYATFDELYDTMLGTEIVELQDGKAWKKLIGRWASRTQIDLHYGADKLNDLYGKYMRELSIEHGELVT